uniref:Uncharacterized protein n=1 Tax=Zea mays TaxID=4577 RepID=C4J7S8_MAIZE|nr:unknown [Zea mays]
MLLATVSTVTSPLQCISDSRSHIRSICLVFPSRSTIRLQAYGVCE